jgi:branched-chain amino acid transport system permease protein
MGVNPRCIYAITAGIGAGLGGAAGNLAAIIFPISPFMGIKFLGITFVVTVLGGVGSVQGCILAGVLYGLIQALSAMFLGVNTQELSAFALFILVLLLRPHGLLGKRFFGEH